LTYAQKFILKILRLCCGLQAFRHPPVYPKLLFLNIFMKLLSSRAIQPKPYFSRVCGSSRRVFNKVIHSLLGLLLKVMKNNNLPVVSRIFMSKNSHNAKVA